MSVCLEASAVLPNSTSTAPEPELIESSTSTSPGNSNTSEPGDVLQTPTQNITKLVLTNTCNNTPVLQKVSTSSVITVINAPGPLTILKTLCSNSYGTSAPQFTLVNSTPLNVCNAVGKPITVVGAPPINVVRTIPNTSTSPQISEDNLKTVDAVTNNASSANDRPPLHNVFVKNSAVSPEVITPSSEMPQVQKLVPANSFLQQNNILQATTKTINGQKAAIPPNNKLKIISNVFVPSPTSLGSNNSNIVLNKSAPPKQYVQQKMMNNSLNGTPKFTNKAGPLTKAGTSTKNVSSSKSQKMVYAAHKNQLRTMPPINNNNSLPKSGIKTLSPQTRGIPNQQVQRSSSGLRTIPPQRPAKAANKPNYIGKHAIQAQKYKNSSGMGRLKNVKPPIPTVNSIFPSRTPPNSAATCHPAITANILQSLNENSVGPYNRSYDFSSRFENDARTSYSDAYIPPPPKPQSNIEALAFVCQAVLLDHNYNATPPAESPPRTTTSANTSAQLNGISVGSYYSSNNNTRIRNLSSSSSTIPSSSVTSVLPNSGMLQDDDAASEISCVSDHKLETEGEETDTAPEAEAVANEDNYDHYGDYVTRCICGFLHDDGYMIECDKCKVWQHVRCVIKSNKKVPDDYLCEVCDPNKPVDRGKARSLQQQWMRENQERELKLRKEVRMREMKLKETLSDSDSSDGEQIGTSVINKSRVGASGRRKSDQGMKLNQRQRRDSTKPENVSRRNIKRKERKTTKKKTKPPPKSQSEDETQETWTHTSISQMPQLRQWIEHYEEAVTNHYSPELRARISSIRINGAHSDISSQMDSSVHKCRIYTQPLTSLKYLVSSIHLPPNTAVIELRGKYMLSTQHRGNMLGHGGNLTTRQHAQRPGPFVFFYRLHKDNTEVCIDTRTYGNDARFIRRSCKPNAELSHCIEKGVLHVYIVTITTVERNLELTIKHDSHDLAVIGTTQVACACGKPEECLINKSSIKKNGECTDLSNLGMRKRRGRRLVSAPPEQEHTVLVKEKKEEILPPSPVEVKQEIEVKVEPKIEEEDIKIKIEVEDIKIEEPPLTILPELEPIKEECKSRSSSPILTPSKRGAHKSDTEEKKEVKECSSMVDKRKLSREERKIEAIMKAFERMERQAQRKQEHQAKQAHRRESEPCPLTKDEDKIEPKTKRRRRKGRSRTISTTSQARRNRLNSADSSYATSGEECLLSPTDSIGHNQNISKDVSCDSSPSKDASLIMLANSDTMNRNDLKSPVQDVDCNSNSANSSPETPLSSACLLVAAAVEPLEPNFKFPKTKKGLMNEWINKSTECIQSASSISPSSLTPHIPTPSESFYDTSSSNSFYTPPKNLVALAQAANYCDLPSQPHGNAKKRWLRQAISEDQCDSPCSRPDSPPLPEKVAPPKKRRLPRESLSTDTTPPTTPTNSTLPPNLMGNEEIKQTHEQEDRVEIVTAAADGDSPTGPVIDDATLKERVAEMQQEIGACFRLPEPRDSSQKDVAQPPPLRCILDPRLSRPMFNNSEHLVATVEKNLSILGFEDQKVDALTPTKRKLSITEYRQRKQLTINEKMEEPPSEENTLSQSPPQKLRPRSDSASSATSFMSSDDEIRPLEIPHKALSAFNSEPTELEKQRETVSLRLKKTFGISIDEDSRKPALNMETILNCDLSSNLLKTQRFSPSFSPSSSYTTAVALRTSPVESPPSAFNTQDSPSKHPIQKEEVEPTVAAENEGQNLQTQVTETCEQNVESSATPEMFYTLDEEEKVEDSESRRCENNEKCDAEYGIESTNYVPPFNNPLYPNNSFASFGSVIDSGRFCAKPLTDIQDGGEPLLSKRVSSDEVLDDDAPYEGRNPSPPPELSSAQNSYSSP